MDFTYLYLCDNNVRKIALEDYSHLRKGFRERERIKRKMARHVKRLESLDELERLAILSAIADRFG